MNLPYMFQSVFGHWCVSLSVNKKHCKRLCRTTEIKSHYTSNRTFAVYQIIMTWHTVHVLVHDWFFRVSVVMLLLSILYFMLIAS